MAAAALLGTGKCRGSAQDQGESKKAGQKKSHALQVAGPKKKSQLKTAQASVK